ncbi:hypothetical protein B0T10DRAFT_453185 [Thelonectria olida]|uniref:AB hydrolase-1 domain-containing protein n=1 Tax=Thelonectria olida TaxID=1576542 RepID=A0A9P8WJW1_9HYPO|nr:hypothetical protein B0T10DRAFT_453185 [Thelonectria olida]
MGNRREKTDAMELDDPSPTLAPSGSSSDASSTRPQGLGSDETTQLEDEEANSGSSSPKEAICARTSFFVNADWRMGSTLANATTIVGQMYTERLDPIEKLHRYPIVLIHGDFHTGQLTKPDGNPGWASYFIRRGFQVYIVDMPPCGRSNFLTGAHFYHRDLRLSSHTISAATIERDLTAQGKDPPVQGQPPTPLKHQRARDHNKWPGTGQRGDPIFASYCASTVTLHLRKCERQSTGQNALQALLKHIGKAFLVGEGSGGNLAWLATDVEPDLVAGVVAIEPAGPPFGTAVSKTNRPRVITQYIEREETTRLYGVADIPLTYDPPTHPHEGFERPVRDPLDIESRMRPDRLGSCFLQKESDPEIVETGPDGKPLSSLKPSQVRQLIHLKKAPHAIVTAHASPHSAYDWATVAFLQQAGLSVEWIRLENLGIEGNGHLMFLETNSDQIAGVIERWITKHETTETSSGIAAVVTPEFCKARSSNTGQTTESEDSSGSKSSQNPPFDPSSNTPVGHNRTLPNPLRASPLSQTQNRPPAAASVQRLEVQGKRTFYPSSPNHVSCPMPSPLMNQDLKRRCVDERFYDAPSAAIQSGSGLVASPQPNQQHRIGTFPSPLSKAYSGFSPQPISNLNMLRPSHPGGPSQLQQQFEIMYIPTQGDQRRGHIAQPIQPPPSSSSGHELYAHLAADTLNGQPQHFSRYMSPRLPAPGDMGFSDVLIRRLPESHSSQMAENLESQQGTLGSVCVSAALRQQLRQADSPMVDPQLSTPIEQQSAPGYSSTPLTPSAQGQLAGYGLLNAVTPPSPSPAPRGARSQSTQSGTSHPAAEQTSGSS